MTPPAGMAGASASGLYDPSRRRSSPRPEEEHAGLIIAILVVLAAGGGIAAFVLMQKQGRRHRSSPGNGSQVAGSNDPWLQRRRDPRRRARPTAERQPAGPIRGATQDRQRVGSSSAPTPAASDVGSDTTAASAAERRRSDVVIVTRARRAEFEVWEHGAQGCRTAATTSRSTRARSARSSIKAKGFKDKKIASTARKQKLAREAGPRSAATPRRRHSSAARPARTAASSMVDRGRCQAARSSTARPRPDDPTCGLRVT